MMQNGLDAVVDYITMYKPQATTQEVNNLSRVGCKNAFGSVQGVLIFNLLKDMKTNVTTCMTLRPDSQAGTAGTLNYLTPELLPSKSQRSSQKSDMFSLGATIYDCYFGSVQDDHRVSNRTSSTDLAGHQGTFGYCHRVLGFQREEDLKTTLPAGITRLGGTKAVITAIMRSLAGCSSATPGARSSRAASR